MIYIVPSWISQHPVYVLHKRRKIYLGLKEKQSLTDKERTQKILRYCDTSAEPIWSKNTYDWSYADFASCKGDIGSQTKCTGVFGRKKELNLRTNTENDEDTGQQMITRVCR